MITEETLEKAGYRKYPEQAVIYPYADFFYQKCVKDDIGKKYFIQFVHYPLMVEKDILGSWMLEMTINYPHYTFEKHHVINEQLESLEKECELFWITFKCEYYEKYAQI